MTTSLPLSNHSGSVPADFKPKNNPAFILHGALQTSFEEVPVPQVGPDEVLVEIKKTGICGSDVHFYNTGRMGLATCSESMCLGHESAGVIVQLGSNVAQQTARAGEIAAARGLAEESNKGTLANRPLTIGDKVALEPGVTCRMCVDCRRGQYQICEHMVFAAYPPFKGGTLSRYFKLPADLVYPLPDSVDLAYGAMMEPLSVATHAVANVGGMRTGWNVLITGAGPVGLLAMAVAKGMGAAKVVAIDINEERLKFAKEYAATDTFMSPPIKPGEKLADWSVRTAAELLQSCSIPERGPGSIDLVVDATGAEACIHMALNAIRPGGVYVQVGFGPPDVSIPMFRVVTNEIQIRGAWRYGSGDYPLAIDLVARGQVNLEPLLTHTFKFKDALEAFEITKAGKDKNGKGVIKSFANWMKSPAAKQYFFSTHFWGPFANWGLPLAALADIVNKDEETISGVMSPTLAAYSMIFMRFAWRVQPRNYLLLACHTTNAAAQLAQEGRWLNYWYFGGREKKHPVGARMEDAKDKVEEKVKDGVEKVKA
ncbi:chlorophyll synthesis pathway protein BchC [Cryptococcus depauperatus]